MKFDDVIVCQQKFSVSAEVLWRAITNVNEMRQWFFINIPDFRAQLGFETKFEVDAGERQFVHVWKIIDMVNHKMINYHWTYEGYSGEGFVCFEIEDFGKSCQLKVSNKGVGTFRPKVPEFSRENCQQGWDYFIKKRLKSYLAKE